MDGAAIENRTSFFRRTRNCSGSNSSQSIRKGSSTRTFLKRRGYGQLDDDDDVLNSDTPCEDDTDEPLYENLLTNDPEEGHSEPLVIPAIPARRMKSSSSSSRNSPVPALPGPPPTIRRQNSRKDRKRPGTLENKKTQAIRQMSVGEQIFPLDEVNNIVPSSKNPFALRPIQSSMTLSSMSTVTTPRMTQSLSQQDYSSVWGSESEPRKDNSDASDDGSSLLLPMLSQLESVGFDQSTPTNPFDFEHNVRVHPEHTEVADLELVDSDSDFEVNDLELDPNSTDEQSRTEYGSTNNLAQFEPDGLPDPRVRPKTLNIKHLSTSVENISPGTPTPCSNQSDARESSVEVITCNENGGDFLLHSLDDNDNQLDDNSPIIDSYETSYSAFVKLPKRSRKPRIKSRQWLPVRVNINDSGLQIFSEDGRLIEEIEVHADESISSIQVEQPTDHSGQLYVLKILRTSYKAKKTVGLGSTKHFSDYQSPNTIFDKYATKVNQVLKIGVKDYLAAHSLANVISKAIRSSDQMSEDVDILAPSPICRLVVDMFDEIFCEIGQDMEIIPSRSTVETAIDILSFAVDSATIRLNDAHLPVDDGEDEIDLICPLGVRLHPMACSNENLYEEEREITFCPVNTTRMEVARFITEYNQFNLPIILKVDYTLNSNHFSIACSMHFNEVQATLKPVTIHLPLPTQCPKSPESWYISNTVGKCKLEGDWIVWTIDSIESAVDDVKQQFLSVTCRGLNSEKLMSHVAILEYEQLDLTAASKAKIKSGKLEIQTQRPIDEETQLINYRSRYFAKVWIRFCVT